MISLTELEAKCKAATHGIWKSDDSIVFYEGESVAIGCRHNDASFIASANPDTVLSLIRIAKAAKSALESVSFTPEDALADALDVLEQSLKEIE